MPRSFRQFLKENPDRIDPKTYNLRWLYHELNYQMKCGLPDNLPVRFGKPPKNATGVTRANGLVRKDGTHQIDFSSIVIEIRPEPFTPDQLKGILAHEMVHASLFHDNVRGAGHDYRFIARMRQFQAHVSFTIPLSDEMDDERRAAMPKKRASMILYQKQDDSYGISFFTPNLSPDDIRFGQILIDDYFMKKLNCKFAMFAYALSGLASKLPIQRGLAPVIKNGKIKPRFPTLYNLPKTDLGLINPQQIIHHAGSLPQF